MPKPRRSSWWISVAIVAILAIMLLSAYLFTSGFHHPGHGTTTGKTLVPSGYSYEAIVGQFESVGFTLNATERMTGAFSTTYGAAVYVMTSAEYEQAVRSGNITTYQWGSGDVHSGSIVDTISAGVWSLVFTDPNEAQSSSVLITTAITLTPS